MDAFLVPQPTDTGADADSDATEHSGSDDALDEDGDATEHARGDLSGVTTEPPTKKATKTIHGRERGAARRCDRARRLL